MIANHSNTIKSVQRLAFYPNQKYEQYEVTVDSLDDGEYYIMIENPSTKEFWQSKAIKAKASAEEFKDAIQGYFNESTIKVELEEVPVVCTDTW